MTDFSISIWNVEHGSSAFLRTPNNRTVIFDVGASEDFSPIKHIQSSEYLRSPESRIDLLVVSHPDQDHIKDLPRLYQELKPRLFYRNKTIPDELIYPDGDPSKSTEAKQYYHKMDSHYTESCSDNYKLRPISNWGDVQFTNIHNTIQDLEQPTTNNLSVVTALKYADMNLIIPGDMEPVGWEALLQKQENIKTLEKGGLRVLLAPHHGRETGIKYDDKVYEKYLKLIKPHLVIMSDKWGTEETRPDLYKPRCVGAKVKSKSKGWIKKKVITTKTNNYVHISHDGSTGTINIP